MESDTWRPGRRPRWPTAVAVSVALHALLLGALWTWRPGPVARRPAPIEVVLVELPPLPPVPRPVPDVAPPGPAPVPDVGPGNTVRDGRISVPDVGPGVGLAAPVAGAPSSPGSTPGAPHGEAPADHPDLAWAASGSTSDRPQPDLTGRPSADLVAFYAPPEPSPEARIQRLLREDQGRERVRSGLADPFFLDFGRSILALWEPERVVTDRGFSGYLTHLGQGIVDYAASYVQQAGNYGRTGSPFGDDGAPLSLAGLAAVPEGVSTQISDQMAGMRALADRSRTRHAALVRVVQRADGRLVSIALVRPSNDSSVDAQALRDLREGASRLPTPTASALAGRTQVASVWEFSLEVSITPPLPMIWVQFDEVLGTVDARVPLDRRLFKLVRLVSVD